MNRGKANHLKGGFHRGPAKQKYGGLISRLRAGIVSADALTYQILDCNPSFLRMFGYSKSDLLRLRVTDLHPTGTLNQIEKALKRKSQFLSEVSCRKAGGTIFFADVQLIRSRRKGKGFIGVIFTDITGRKRILDHMLKALREKELLVQAQSELMITLNPQGEILSANRSTFEALGYGKPSLIGRELANFLPPRKEKEMLEVLTRASLGETIRAFDTELVRKNGQTLSVRVDLIPITTEDSKKIHCIILTCCDTTEQSKLICELTVAKKEVEELYQELRDAYQELKEMQDELVRQEKLVATGELAAAVAHEIRNPLSIINMSVQYIHGKLAPEDSLREFTEAIIEKVNQVDRVTKELIDYGRPRELVFRTVDIQRVIDSVLRLAAARAHSQRVEIHRNFSRYLPLVKVDAERMNEVFSNLVTNALDAMPEGGHLTVATKEDIDEKQVHVEIGNTGKGIPPRKRAELFTPFFTTKPDGIGLGLAICQRIVDEHHGTISAESKINGPNKGTRFIATLPIASREKEPSPIKIVDEPLVEQKAV
jgi:PAS domain S-box-containing protein